MGRFGAVLFMMFQRLPGGRKRVGGSCQRSQKDAFQRAFEALSAQKRGERPGGACVALAHNREDLAETMLHNLARGTGLRGLSTMRPAGDGIIRPVLCLGREEIAAYAKKMGSSALRTARICQMPIPVTASGIISCLP